MCDLTIGMPVFNDVQYIEQSLNSILNQTYTEYKLIISDDGSMDGSQQICTEFAKKDSRITYIRQPNNLGISKNMQFLLSKGNTPFFMWAGDDDLYDETFIEKHIDALKYSDSVSVFCNFEIIDENGLRIRSYDSLNYEHWDRNKRLFQFIRNSHDAFGYGIFRTEEIKNVEFPVWWWPNRKSPYNNIFPTLCYYLTKGNYIHIDGKSLFSKREKTGSNINHVLTGESNAIKESLSFWIRKFNLVIFSAKLIRKASTFSFMISILPHLFYFWFVVPSISQFLLAVKSFYNNRINN